MEGYEKTDLLGLNIISKNTLPRADVFQENYELLEKSVFKTKEEISNIELKDTKVKVEGTDKTLDVELKEIKKVQENMQTNKATKGEILPSDIKGNTRKQIVVEVYNDIIGDLKVCMTDENGTVKEKWLTISQKFANKKNTEDALAEIKDLYTTQNEILDDNVTRLKNANDKLEAML